MPSNFVAICPVASRDAASLLFVPSVMPLVNNDKAASRSKRNHKQTRHVTKAMYIRPRSKNRNSRPDLLSKMGWKVGQGENGT